MIYQHGFSVNLRLNVHSRGVSLLNCEPSRLIKAPSITKLAATKGVGAMIVVTILKYMFQRDRGKAW